MQFLAMPLVPPALAFAVGIAVAPALSAAAAWWLWSLGVLGVLGMTVLRRVAWAAAPLLASVVALGALRAMPARLPADHIANVRLPALARVEARLVGEPRRWSVDRTRLVLEVARVDDERRTGRIQVTLYGEAPPLAAGQRVAAELRLHAATGFRNPGGFDYAAHLAREGIGVVGTSRA